MQSQILCFSTMGRNGLILIYLHLRVINEFVSVRLIKWLGLGSRSICFLLPQPPLACYLSMVVGYMTAYSISAYHQ
jgi:hypothetical protein